MIGSIKSSYSTKELIDKPNAHWHNKEWISARMMISLSMEMSHRVSIITLMEMILTFRETTITSSSTRLAVVKALEVAAMITEIKVSLRLILTLDTKAASKDEKLHLLILKVFTNIQIKIFER